MAFKTPDDFRFNHPMYGMGDESGGAFEFPSPIKGWSLFVVAANGEGWEHVSVHARDAFGQKRTPTWDEMCHVKDLFWGDDDVVMQLHPAKSRYINVHANVLHLWRPVGVAIPLPPLKMV